MLPKLKISFTSKNQNNPECKRHPEQQQNKARSAGGCRSNGPSIKLGPLLVSQVKIVYYSGIRDLRVAVTAWLYSREYSQDKKIKEVPGREVINCRGLSDPGKLPL